jgi:hypothetical protein
VTLVNEVAVPPVPTASTTPGLTWDSLLTTAGSALASVVPGDAGDCKRLIRMKATMSTTIPPSVPMIGHGPCQKDLDRRAG